MKAAALLLQHPPPPPPPGPPPSNPARALWVIEEQCEFDEGEKSDDDSISTKEDAERGDKRQLRARGEHIETLTTRPSESFFQPTPSSIHGRTSIIATTKSTEKTTVTTTSNGPSRPSVDNALSFKDIIARKKGGKKQRRKEQRRQLCQTLRCGGKRSGTSSSSGTEATVFPKLQSQVEPRVVREHDERSKGNPEEAAPKTNNKRLGDSDKREGDDEGGDGSIPSKSVNANLPPPDSICDSSMVDFSFQQEDEEGDDGASPTTSDNASLVHEESRQAEEKEIAVQRDEVSPKPTLRPRTLQQSPISGIAPQIRAIDNGKGGRQSEYVVVERPWPPNYAVTSSLIKRGVRSEDTHLLGKAHAEKKQQKKHCEKSPQPLPQSSTLPSSLQQFSHPSSTEKTTTFKEEIIVETEEYEERRRRQGQPSASSSAVITSALHEWAKHLASRSEQREKIALESTEIRKHVATDQGMPMESRMAVRTTAIEANDDDAIEHVPRIKGVAVQTQHVCVVASDTTDNSKESRIAIKAKQRRIALALQDSVRRQHMLELSGATKQHRRRRPTPLQANDEWMGEAWEAGEAATTSRSPVSVSDIPDVPAALQVQFDRYPRGNHRGQASGDTSSEEQANHFPDSNSDGDDEEEEEEEESDWATLGRIFAAGFRSLPNILMDDYSSLPLPNN